MIKISHLITLLWCSSLIAQYNFRGDNPYERLNLSYRASEKEIKSRCRQLMFAYHPDKYPESEKSTAQKMFVQINDDCDMLKRKSYADYEFSDRYQRPKDPPRQESYRTEDYTYHSTSGNQKTYANFEEEFFKDDFYKRFKDEQERFEKEREQQKNFYEEFKRQNYNNWDNDEYTYNAEDNRYYTSLKGAFHIVASPLFDLPMRQSYFKFNDEKSLYGTISVTPLLNHVESDLNVFNAHVRGNFESTTVGGLVNYLMGYKSFWLEFVALLGYEEEHFSYLDNLLYRAAIVGQSGILNEMLYLGYKGSFWDDRYKLRYYIFASFPGQYTANATFPKTVVIAGSPFYSFGYGGDTALTFFTHNTGGLLGFLNYRAQFYKSDYIEGIHIKNTTRLDLLLGLKGWGKYFDIEIGENFIMQVIHDTEPPSAQAQSYALLNVNYKSLTMSLGGSINYSLQKHVDTLGFSTWLNLGYVF